MRSNRRLVQLAIALAAAAVLVVVAIVVSSGGDDEQTPRPVAQAGERLPGQHEVAEQLEGVPQDGIALGDPDAPLTVVEFVDLQCPFCAEFTARTLPRVIDDYVKPGKVRMELQTLAFLGDDSVTGARAAAAAAEQDRLWQFAELFLRNQGEENSGFVTDDFIASVYGAVDGLDVQQAEAARVRPEADRLAAAAGRAANQAGVDGTPAFFVRRGAGGELKPLETGSLEFGDFQRALDAELGG